VDLRCRVLRARSPLELEAVVNEFLTEEIDGAGEAQIEAITQSEGEGGVTVVIWYLLVEEQGLEANEEPSEADQLS
jgi:hypothetical protein